MQKLMLTLIGMTFIFDNSAISQVTRQSNHTIEASAFGMRCNSISDATASLRRAAAAVSSDTTTLDLPSGTCVLTGTIYLKSHTHVVGLKTTLVAGEQWVAGPERGYSFFRNVDYDHPQTPDEDISIANITFDYGKFGSIPVKGGGKHAIDLHFVKNSSVTNSIFYLRGAEDAIAGISVSNLLVEGNSAFEFRNCAYDFWASPSNVKLINNLAETSHSAQIVNFNPDDTDKSAGTEVARGFIMANNKLIVTGPRASVVFIAPIGKGPTVQNVSVTNNSMDNTFILLRGAVKNATIKDNTISNVRGGMSVIGAYPWNGGTGQLLTIDNNKIVNPDTSRLEQGVIRIEAKKSCLSNNSITGSKYMAAQIFKKD